MKLQTNLPPRVHALAYVKNSHFLEIEDDDGNRTKVSATGIVKYECTGCKFKFFVLTNHGEISCPLCRQNGAAKPQWMTPQLSFVPEKQSDFKGGFDFEVSDDERGLPPKG